MALRLLDQFTIYRDDRYYSSFPSLVQLPDGTILCGFRRAPERRLQPGGKVTHGDPNSQAVLVTSTDGGQTWSEPKLIYAHPEAGCQDPCLNLLSDGTVLATFFAWKLLPMGCEKAIDGPAKIMWETNGWPMVNIGPHVMRSEDGGKTWEGPVQIPPAPGHDENLSGRPALGAVRGGLVELADGALLLPVYAHTQQSVSTVYRSTDRGHTWEYLSTIAADDTVHFHEPHLHVCPSGKVVAFLRTAALDGYLALSESTDGGQTWSPWQKNEIWGHPFTTARTPDGRTLVAYGYRREPFGVRAVVVDAECEQVSTAGEIVLRDDLGSTDIGYPWAVALSDGRLLVAYYANHADGPRSIEASVLGE